MSDNYERLYKFFTDLGFSVQRSERLEYFGDYIIEACSPYFCVKGVSDRSVESIEVRNLTDAEDWYDINLLMACIGYEDRLREVLTLESEMKFVENHLDELAAVFDKENYRNTKTKLEELGMQRAKSAFPRWHP